MADAHRTLLQPMERRPLLVPADPGPLVLRGSDEEVLYVGTLPLLRRGLTWAWSWARYTAARTADRIAGRTDDRTRGRRLRELLERVGGTAIKIGQQLSVRADFFPLEVCDELSKLTDAVPPVPLDDVRDRIEAAAGAPLDEVFASIDPTPIGSASIATVWRAERRDGRRVALKVRRPGVAASFAADLTLIERVTGLVEALALARTGSFKHLNTDLRAMLLGELDFALEAHFQVRFRQLVRKAGLKWADAPRVHADLSSRDVLVTDFVDGVSCQELLERRSHRDAEGRTIWEATGLSRKRLAKRVAELAYWMRVEAGFFHSDPHPGNVFAMPGDKLMFIDFGACGITSRSVSTLEYEMNRRAMRNDMAGMAAMAMAASSPLPDIDLHRFSERIRRLLWARQIDVYADDVAWWEVTTSTMWLSLIAETGEFGIPLNIDALRTIRSSLLYDTLCLRLDPDIDMVKEYRRYVRKLAARSEQQRQQAHDPQADLRFLVSVDQLRDSVDKATFWFNRNARQHPHEFLAASKKIPLFVSAVLRAVLVVGLGLLALVYARLLLGGLFGGDVPLWGLLVDTASHPLAMVTAILAVLWVLRRIAHRMRKDL
jgi:predicted unusual protein kinase regulating ubiquinone biosynthesis (AarF/ABC1/UbiB family)